MNIKHRIKILLDDLMNIRKDYQKGFKSLSNYNKGYCDGIKEAHYLLFCLWLEYRNKQGNDANKEGK